MQYCSGTHGFASKHLRCIHVTKPPEVPAALNWAIAAVRVASLLWERHRRCQEEHFTSMPPMAAQAPAEASNPYRAAIDILLTRGRELVAEVNTVPTEERQDVIADELNAIAKQIYELLDQEAALLKGKNS